MWCKGMGSAGLLYVRVLVDADRVHWLSPPRLVGLSQFSVELLCSVIRCSLVVLVRCSVAGLVHYIG